MASSGQGGQHGLNWAVSQQVGGITELAVLAPIRTGIVTGERRSYEDRLRAAIANLAKRHRQGIPIELDRVTTIHFGRMIVIRPEQFLGFPRFEPPRGGPPEPDARTAAPDAPEPPSFLDRLAAWDEFEPADDPAAAPLLATPKAPAGDGPELRSWLLTLVEFDGELKSYMREIVNFLGSDFDRIFENCELYPRSTNFETFWIWIRTFQISTDLFYAPYRDLSVVRIRQLEAFKRRFDAFVARVRSPAGPTVRSMDELFDEFLRENQQYASGFPAPGGTYDLADERQKG